MFLTYKHVSNTWLMGAGRVVSRFPLLGVRFKSFYDVLAQKQKLRANIVESYMEFM
jgi:hypothetical protein